ncbi:MAG: DUF2344 domain-containing protein [bacterium]|nr:DUF2344 domain-containing protein [bacterium]
MIKVYAETVGQELVPVDDIHGSTFRRAGEIGENLIYRYAVEYAVEGDARFCSHRDMIRLFTRALARSELPVRFSEGFNPHPKISLVPPRPVGVATDADRLVVQLTETLEGEELCSRLSGTMPRGITILRAWKLSAADRCQPHRVHYLVALSAPDREHVSSRIAHLVGSDPVIVDRVNKNDGRLKRVDIAPYLDTLEITDQGLLMVLRTTTEGTAKPAEVCAVLGVTNDAVLSWTRRVRVEWM